MSNIDFQNGFAIGMAAVPGKTQSDWNQNDSTAKDYIKNRPFYAETIKNNDLICEYQDDIIFFGHKIGLEVNKDYTIDIYKKTGAIETITLQAFDAMEIFGVSAIVLGDGESVPFVIADGAIIDDNGVPSEADNAFYMFTDDIYSKIVVHGIESVQEIVHKMDAKYLPEELVKDQTITGEKLANDIIESKHLKRFVVTSEKISNNAVTNEKIASNAVTSDKILDGAVTNKKIRDDAVTNEKIASNAVTSEKLAPYAVRAGAIDNSAVTADKIHSGAVTTDKISNGAVTNGKLASGISHFKLSEPAQISEFIVEEGQSVGLFSESNSTLFGRIGQRNVICGEIVSNDNENKEQALKFGGRLGTLLTLAELTADFSNSKKWSVWCEIERISLVGYKITMILTSTEGENISTLSTYTSTSDDLKQLRLNFGDAEMAYGTVLRIYSYN